MNTTMNTFTMNDIATTDYTYSATSDDILKYQVRSVIGFANGGNANFCDVSNHYNGDYLLSGFWLNGSWMPFLPGSLASHYPWYAPTENKTEKSFQIAKALVAKNRVDAQSVDDFVALVEDIKEAL